ncbi:MAG TPA: hypothetical protein PLN63_05295 [Paludibacteraceae bacterium]|nr:hypothetical protein [Paludibacteraceae bacterium]HOU68016.1 hypothetical protein [Paludibacteraceae bacterium]HPH63015.1 hypothetical protein [Paludibacteraceae bacterium]HQF49941.1 hypothetical protein [Paludibacteraceae bacterium]
MNLYQIDYRKLVALLLPTMLRKPIIIIFLQCATLAVKLRHHDFLSNRDSNMYRLQHNGQVCHLRALLNEAFPTRSTDFIIEDSSVTSEFVYAMSEAYFPYDQMYVPVGGIKKLIN